jgi:hypothetical protein
LENDINKSYKSVDMNTHKKRGVLTGVAIRVVDLVPTDYIESAVAGVHVLVGG